jgi:tRNA dimethylallyltransferase
MFDNGLVDEALRLRARLAKDHWALTVMGYQEALLYHDGLLSLKDAQTKTAIRHRQYAKRQFTWFNKESFYHFVIS